MSAVSGVFTATPIDDGDGGGAREAEEEEEDAEWATRTRTRTHATSTRRTLPEQPQPRPAAPDGPNESHTLRADPRDDRGDDSTDSIGPDLLDLDLARPSDPPHRDRDRNALGSSLAALPAFVSRLAAGPGSGAGTGGAKRGRGWKAYESILPGGGSTVAGRHVVVDEYGELEEIEDSDEEEEEEDPVPGAFVVAAGATPPPGAAAHHPQATTLHVYPVPGPGGESEPADGAKYRDAGWIVAYGVSLLAVVALALQAWWTSPPRFPADRAPGTPGGGSNMYRMLLNSAVPNLLALALVSSLAGIASLAYLATIQHLLPALLSLAVIAGPALFVSIGVVAIGGTFSVEGVASDAGWRVGVRVFAVGLFVAAVVLGRSAAVRQKELNRAISVGQLACQTVLDHPHLRLFVFYLSLLSVLLSVPFLGLITTLLTYAPSSPRTASWGTAATLLVYLWTLAIGRGLCHATVGGCVGTWYFEREDQEYSGPLEVTKASIARATGPSLGTVIAASFFVALFSTLATVLRTLRRLLLSTSLPSLLRPLTALAPLCAALAGYAAFFNSYALSYAGMTGEGFWSASRETRELLRANRARNIRDTALLRLTLFITSSAWGLLTGLVAFFLTSYHLTPRSGGFTPTLAVLCYAVPLYTLRLCHNLVGDAVDALFVCTHLDAENQVAHCPKAVEAFGTPESDAPPLSLPI